MGRRRILRRRGRIVRVGEGLTPSRAFSRVYPQVGKVDTVYDVQELISCIENDNIPRDLKRKRLHYLYTLTFSSTFKEGFKGDIREARRLAKKAYQEYMDDPEVRYVKRHGLI